jgi:hypothetical protein
MDDLEDWRFTAVSVTKYNPKYRNEKGRYLKKDWTSISDIGRSYGEKVLERKEYLRVESCYVAVVKAVCELLGTQHFRINSLYKTSDDSDFGDADRLTLLPFYKKLSIDEVYTKSDIENLVHIALREYATLDIHLSAQTVIRFGYDYYMYINTDLSKEVVATISKTYKLYID